MYTKYKSSEFIHQLEKIFGCHYEERYTVYVHKYKSSEFIHQCEKIFGCHYEERYTVYVHQMQKLRIYQSL